MVSLKTLTVQDIGQAIRLSNAERWNQTEKDWKLLVGNPENICLSASDGEKVIGTATAINYDNDVAWIGMMLVDREYRGRGVSKLLLSGLFEQLKSCRSLKLDATPAGQPVYQKFGFKDEYLIHRMTAPPVSLKALPFDDGHSMEQVQPNNIPEVIEYDKQVFGANRRQLIEFLIENDQENAWVIRQNGKISGLALVRKGTRFYQIGPVFASGTEDAKKLIAKSLEGLVGQPLVIDILNDKKELMDWLIILGFSQQRPFVRMYQNENPFPGMPENQFLICGPEFG
jgi:GNAT superfamily N-acetyltransferase